MNQTPKRSKSTYPRRHGYSNTTLHQPGWLVFLLIFSLLMSTPVSLLGAEIVPGTIFLNGYEQCECQDELTCTVDVCLDGESCGFILNRNTCLIDGTCWTESSPDPGNACQACLSAVSQAEWSSLENGTGCDDNLFCTVNDECKDGVCTGAPRDCSAVADQCNIGVCNGDLLRCIAEPVAAGTPCDDGDVCTLGDTCKSGLCSGEWDEINCPR